jgi:hypothetical protein
MVAASCGSRICPSRYPENARRRPRGQVRLVSRRSGGCCMSESASEARLAHTATLIHIGKSLQNQAQTLDTRDLVYTTGNNSNCCQRSQQNLFILLLLLEKNQVQRFKM